MHEMHIIKDMFSDLLKHTEENNVEKVTKVYLRMGDFTEINEEILRFHFAENSKNTPLEGAELEFEKSPTRELRLLSYDCD
jgi:hydrogenase nickel incorporation protein HypA/HybF